MKKFLGAWDIRNAIPGKLPSEWTEEEADQVAAILLDSIKETGIEDE